MPKPAQKPATRDKPKPAQKPVPSGDRGYGGGGAQRPAAKPMPANRPSPSAQPRPSKPTAVSGANRGGGSANAASQRGKQSMPQGARSKGGGGGKKKAR
jgi:outer membrane biosynthesis protein TonB